MGRVWSERGREPAFGSGSKRQAARQAKYKYQAKETELETARSALARLETSVRGKRSELARLKQMIEKRRLELVQSEERRRTLEKMIQDLDPQVSSQRARVRQIEHEVEQLREAAFRGHQYGGPPD